MTQNEKKDLKDLLLKDLCARLPYGVKVRYSSYEKFITCTLHAINPVYHIVDLWGENACFNPVDTSKIKPYLFPLSSMTEEQEKEWRYTLSSDGNITYDTVDWCNENHLDYRGLIPMDLAIDATGLNIY